MINNLINSSINLMGGSVYQYNEYTLQELLSRFFESINNCIDETNKAITIMEWVKKEGLPIEVQTYLNNMLVNGSLEDLINKTIFATLNTKVELNSNEISNLKNKLITLSIDGGSF